MTAKEAVMSVDKERTKLEKEAEALNDLLAQMAEADANGENVSEEQDEVMDRRLANAYCLGKGTVYSADLDFMNSVCTHMVLMSKKTLVTYGGNYDSYVQTKTELDEEQMKRYKWEQDEIKKMKEYVARFGHGTAKNAKQAQSKEKTLEKMMRGGLTDKVEVEKALDFNFLDPGQLSPPVLQCNDIAFGYPGCEILYQGVDFGVDLDSRVALVGPNGAGK
ncbi:ABCF1, partial [Symbiodinium microadriaticum]